MFANDNDPQKKEMYEGHFGLCSDFVLDDIYNIARDVEQVPSATVAHASFPCTDLSLAGARRGINAGQSSAFWGFIQLIENLAERKPPLLLIENVTGLLSSHDGNDFHELLLAINKLGYKVDVFVLDAASFVPQSRPRLFVAGTLSSCLDYEAVDKVEPCAVRPKKLVERIQSLDDVEFTLLKLPSPPIRCRETLADVLDKVPDHSEQWWSADRAAKLLRQMSDRHLAIAHDMIRGRKWRYGSVFRRMRNGQSMAELRTDGLAGCLRTPKGGSGRQILFRGGYGRYMVRLLNANECARLMGADGYNVTTRLNQALFGFGDAVCVDAVAWLAEHWLEPHAARLTAAGSSRA